MKNGHSLPTLLTSRLNQLTKGKSINIYTDSKCALHILLSHTVISIELGLQTTKGGSITNSDQIIAMLKASHLSTALGTVCPIRPTTPLCLRKITEMMRQLELQPSKAQITLFIAGNPCTYPYCPPLTLDKFCPIYISSLILVATRILSHFFKPPPTL